MAKEVFKCDHPDYEAAIKQRDEQLLEERHRTYEKITVDNDPGNYAAAVERVLHEPFRRRKAINSCSCGTPSPALHDVACAAFVN